jgi:hypothetical protein
MGCYDPKHSNPIGIIKFYRFTGDVKARCHYVSFYFIEKQRKAASMDEQDDPLPACRENVQG